jgi:MFS family permease
MFTSGFPMMLGGRILTGVGVGLVSLAVPVYVAEIAPANLRGGLGVINQLVGMIRERGKDTCSN